MDSRDKKMKKELEELCKKGDEPPGESVLSANSIEEEREIALISTRMEGYKR